MVAGKRRVELQGEITSVGAQLAKFFLLNQSSRFTGFTGQGYIRLSGKKETKEKSHSPVISFRDSNDTTKGGNEY